MTKNKDKKVAKKKAKFSDAEEQFLKQLRIFKLPEPEREFRFHDTRRWRFDFAYPDDKIAVEIEGGVFSRGRHLRPEGYIADLEKYNWAAFLGWRVYRFATRWITDLTAVDFLARALGLPPIKKEPA